MLVPGLRKHGILQKVTDVAMENIRKVIKGTSKSIKTKTN